ncbi:hypothetical protein [Mesorhizobium sp. M0435]|uniref:hypothetical protein n=1 Tax=Mesorhizobium sp. M0435 TaxID=2956944 RepID=UPI00333D73F8
MSIGRDPAFLSPMKHLLKLYGKKLSFSGDRELSPDRLDFKTFRNFQVNVAQGEFDRRRPEM